VKTSEIPCTLRCGAPSIGEHNEEIYRNEIGLTKEEIIALRQAGII
jgi:formyl-CoA transferase